MTKSLYNYYWSFFISSTLISPIMIIRRTISNTLLIIFRWWFLEHLW